jgi:polyferredoxin
MKEVLINLVNWFFNNHEVSLTGWQMLLWILGYPLVFLLTLGVVFGYIINCFSNPFR